MSILLPRLLTLLLMGLAGLVSLAILMIGKDWVYGAIDRMHARKNQEPPDITKGKA